MSASSLTLQFGIEMEFLLRPKSDIKESLRDYGFSDTVTTDSKDDHAKGANRTALRRALVDSLDIGEIAAGLSTQSYEEWTVTDEPSLDERPGFCMSTAGLRAL
jgi:hypothetical protein